MKCISWNVNGLRACVGKGFEEVFRNLDADFFCLQETKLQPGQISLETPGYSQFWNSAEKKGYSGTAIFAKKPPLSVTYGIGIPELDTEGRLITLEYDRFYLVTCYTPNSQQELKRLDHRLSWDKAFREYLVALDAKKPVIACGDLNASPRSSPPGLRTASAACTRKRSSIPGGPTASRTGPRMLAGALTIFWCLTASGITSPRRTS